MIRATRALRPDALGGAEIVDRVVLDHGDRHRRRLRLTGVGGLTFLLDLPEARRLDDGDALALEDGRLVWVEAAAEPLLEIRAPDEHALRRLIWHLGNRHVAAEIGADAVWIARDHVLAEMVRGLGGSAEPVERPFRPEGGAYAGGHGHSHDHRAHEHRAHDHHAHEHHAHEHHGHSHDHDSHGRA